MVMYHSNYNPRFSYGYLNSQKFKPREKQLVECKRDTPWSKKGDIIRVITISTLGDSFTGSDGLCHENEDYMPYSRRKK